MPADLTPSQWGWGLVAALLLGMSKTGFTGVALLGIAIMAGIFPARQSTGVILPMLICADVLAVSMFSRHALWREILRVLPPALVGIVLGYLVFLRIPGQVFGPLIGGIILALTALQLWQRQQARRPKPHPGRTLAADPSAAGVIPRPLASLAFGVLSGMTTMLANAAGPVMTIYLLSAGLAKYAFTGTSAWIFFLINLSKLPFSYALGVINGVSLWFNLLMLPAIVAGIWLGRALLRRIPQLWFDRVLLFSAIVAGLRLLWQ